MDSVTTPRRGRAAKQEGGKLWVAVHGLMVHPYTQAVFNVGAAVPHNEDSWVAVQVEAGKLREHLVNSDGAD